MQCSSANDAFYNIPTLSKVRCRKGFTSVPALMLCSTMPTQMRRSDKTFPARVARIRSFPGVRALVSLKRAVLRETFGTVLASERSLSAVFVHVSLKITILRERLRTKLTLIRLDIVVDKLMTLEMTEADKGSRAFVASERFFACNK